MAKLSVRFPSMCLVHRPLVTLLLLSGMDPRCETDHHMFPASHQMRNAVRGLITLFASLPLASPDRVSILVAVSE